MEIKEFFGICQNLEIRLSERGFVTPNIEGFINWSGDELCLKVSHRVHKDIALEYKWFSGSADEAVDILDNASAFIENLETPESLQKKQFIKSLGQLIDIGREIGIEVEHINPLTNMMEKLSTNILEAAK
jgi:hypothetical protein